MMKQWIRLDYVHDLLYTTLANNKTLLDAAFKIKTQYSWFAFEKAVND